MDDIKLPINFEEKAKLPASANGTGYPYRISASDLMANFTYAALNVENDWYENESSGKYLGRKLKLPKMPTSGTHVLGCIDGEIQWIETESC
jgi:hypothetical protein